MTCKNCWTAPLKFYKEEYSISQEYAQIIVALQEIAESLRDTVIKSYVHVNNHHKGLLEVQKKELLEIRMYVTDLLHESAEALMERRKVDLPEIKRKNKQLKTLINSFDRNQIKRIQDESSKTRLSILFYGIMGNAEKISDNTVKLLKIFSGSLSRSYARIKN